MMRSGFWVFDDVMRRCTIEDSSLFFKCFFDNHRKNLLTRWEIVTNMKQFTDSSTRLF